MTSAQWPTGQPLERRSLRLRLPLQPWLRRKRPESANDTLRRQKWRAAMLWRLKNGKSTAISVSSSPNGLHQHPSCCNQDHLPSGMTSDPQRALPLVAKARIPWHLFASGQKPSSSRRKRSPRKGSLVPASSLPRTASRMASSALK